MRKALAVVLLLLTTPALAQIGDSLGIDPFKDWKTIETERFRITFAASERVIARKFADHLEEAHALLSPYLRWTPAHKVQVVVLDTTDSANGLTTPIGRFGIVLYSAPPETWFSTRYYDDWPRLLAIHEYAHYLNMDTTRGLWQALRYVIGDALLPNTLLPAWMLEGLAAFAETKFSRGGRGRSTYYRMINRAAAEEDLLDSPEFITLDKVNGRNPYPPGGETAYAFGYALMNQAAQVRGPGPSGDAALGELSFRSGNRVPYFINGNLENTIGRTWPDVWSEWVAKARQSANRDRATIVSQRVSSFDLLTDPAHRVLGSALSPDGRWLAYTLSSQDEEMGLFVRDLGTGEVRRLSYKTMGSRISFTPDSRRIVGSELRRRGGYTFLSDLVEIEVDSGRRRWLSDGWRARDPQLSADGKTIVFTTLRDSTTHLARAGVSADESGELRLSALEILYSPDPFDAINTPAISADGSRVAFTRHRNGDYAEDLYEIEPGKAGVRLIGNGSFHSHPVYSAGGVLYYVSDLSGVDNLYRFDRASNRGAPVTNVTTGLAFPTLTRDGALYAALYRGKGWTLSRVEILPNLKPLVGLEKAEFDGQAPAPVPAQPISTASAEEKDYSVFPSLWPRQWAPLFFGGSGGALVGGQVLGFDALEKHSYLLFGGYDTWADSPNWYARYANRQLGATLSLFSSGFTEDFSFAVPTRHYDHGVSLSYPFQFTRSTLYPYLALDYERYANATGYRSRSVPVATAAVTLSSARTTPLGINAEWGVTTSLGARAYFDTLRGTTSYKGLFSHEHHLRLTQHSVLVPSLKASMTSSRSDNLNANVLLSGGYTNRLVDRIEGASLSEIGIRGYPDMLFSLRSVAVGAVDYRFPIARIFRGWSTNPAFVENLHGFVFGETAYLASSSLSNKTLPSAGGGLVLDTELFFLPVTVSVTYARGFREALGGDHEVFVQIAGPGLAF